MAAIILYVELRSEIGLKFSHLLESPFLKINTNKYLKHIILFFMVYIINHSSVDYLVTNRISTKEIN